MRCLITGLILAAFLLPVVAQTPVPDSGQPTAGRKMGLAKPLVFEKDKEVYGAPLEPARASRSSGAP